MKNYHICITAALIFSMCKSINSDNWILFKKKENVDGQICLDSDSVFSKKQIFDKSVCVLGCVNHSGCKSVFHGQYAGECIGCVASYDISSQPAGLGDNLVYYWQPNCPDGWMIFANSCYFITDTKMNFESGVAKCQLLNARAVIIDNEEENNYLKRLINSTFTHTDEESGFFTGFTDIYTEGTWVEYGTSNQMTFRDWGNGEPNNQGIQEDCLALYFPLALKWADVQCSWAQRIICERNL